MKTMVHQRQGHHCPDCSDHWHARVRRAVEYLNAPGDPSLYADQEAIAEALTDLVRTINPNLTTSGGAS